MKKALSFILALVMVFGSVPLAAFSGLNTDKLFPLMSMTAEAASSVVITTGDANPYDMDTWLSIDSGRIKWTCSSSSVKSYRYTVVEVDRNGQKLDSPLVELKLTTSKYFNLSSLNGMKNNTLYKVWVGGYTDSSGSSILQGDGGCVAYFCTDTSAPTVSTGEATDIGETSVTLYGSLEKNGGAPVTDHGFIIATSKSRLTIAKGNVYSLGSAGGNKGTFSSKIIDLSRSKTYYFTYYARNEQGISYGDTGSFTTTCSHSDTAQKISTSEDVIFKSISSTDHEIKCYYDTYCTLCDQTLQHAYKYDTTTEPHSFNSAGICEECGHAKSCAHKNKSKEYYNERYDITNGSSHEYVRYYKLVCKDCGIETDTRVMWDTVTQNHSFSNNKCTKCGYVKNEALSVTLTADSAKANVNTNIGATAKAVGGSGGYLYSYAVFNGNGEELSYLSYSESIRFSYMPKNTGSYYFKVTVKDSNGASATAVSDMITVICPHETYDASKFKITSSPEYEQHSETQHCTVWYYNWDCTVCSERYKEHVTDEDNRILETHEFNAEGICGKCSFSCPHTSTENKTVTYTVSNIGNSEKHKVDAAVSMNCKQCKSKISFVEEYDEPHNGNGMVKLSNGAITCSCQYEENMPSSGSTMYILKNEKVYSSIPSNRNRKPVGSVYGPKAGVDGDKVTVLGYTGDNSYAYIQYSTSNGTKRGFVSSGNLSKTKPVIKINKYDGNATLESSSFAENFGLSAFAMYSILSERNDTAALYTDFLRNSLDRHYYRFLEFDYSTNYYELAMAELMLTTDFVYHQAEILEDNVKLGIMNIAGNLLAVAKNKNIFIENEETFLESVASVIDGTGLEGSAAHKYTTKILSQIMDNTEGFTAENISSIIYNGGEHLSDLADLADDALTMIDLFTRASNMCVALDAYEAMDDDFKTVFRYAATQTTDSMVKNAFSYYSDIYRETWQKKVLAWTKAGIKAADLATFDYVGNITISFTKKQIGNLLTLLEKKGYVSKAAASGVISSIVIGAKLGIAFSKALLNTEQLNEDLSMAIAYYDISACFRKAYNKYYTDYERSKTYTNACLTSKAMQVNASLLMLFSNELLSYYNAKQNHFMTAIKDHCQKKLGKTYSFAQQLGDINFIRQGANMVYNSINELSKNKSNLSSEAVMSSSHAVKVACPVDVYIYDNSGNLLCYTNGTKAYNNSYSVSCCVIGEEKYILLPESDKYTVKIIGTDNGTMDVSVSMLNKNNTVTDEVSYNDIPVSSSEQYNTVIKDDFFESPEKQVIASGTSDYYPSEVKSYVKITGIEIVSNPEKTSYTYKSASSPDLTGMVIKATYSDGSTEMIDDISCVEVKDFSSSAPVGNKVATVEYKGCTAQFNYSVSYAWWQMLIRIFLMGFIWY